MTTFSEELRKAREAKNLSLAEISRITRINLKYLEAIDQGSFDVLPQTYIRAFLREYAQTVGLSPVEVIQKYEILVTGKFAAGQTPAQAPGWSGEHVPTLHEPPVNAERERPTEAALVKQRSMRTVVIIASIVVLCSLILAYVANYIWVGHNAPGVRETPFKDVVREKEIQNAPPPVVDTSARAAADSLAARARLDSATAQHRTSKETTAVAVRPVPPVAGDSLTLTIVPTERVWISVERDTLKFRSMDLAASSPVTIRAKRRFVLTLGNAGGASYLLNGKDLGVLGKRGDVIRNIVMTRDGIVSPGTRQLPKKQQGVTQ
ncbi:MAG TPA: RodZ domain-containing protein [Bacteroidota bacterium]|nr:RodZ domain-containing protein [Bacteroidota bacterium]